MKVCTVFSFAHSDFGSSIPEHVIAVFSFSVSFFSLMFLPFSCSQLNCVHPFDNSIKGIRYNRQKKYKNKKCWTLVVWNGLALALRIWWEMVVGCFWITTIVVGVDRKKRGIKWFSFYSIDKKYRVKGLFVPRETFIVNFWCFQNKTEIIETKNEIWSRVSFEE